MLFVLLIAGIVIQTAFASGLSFNKVSTGTTPTSQDFTYSAPVSCVLDGVAFTASSSPNPCPSQAQTGLAGNASPSPGLVGYPEQFTVKVNSSLTTHLPNYGYVAAQGNSSGWTYTCPAGTTRSGVQCNGPLTSAYTCPAGTTLSGSSCIGPPPTANYGTCPAGTVILWLGLCYVFTDTGTCPPGTTPWTWDTWWCFGTPSTTYTCSAGFTLSGSQCLEPATPVASCPAGLSRVGSVCIGLATVGGSFTGWSDGATLATPADGAAYANCVPACKIPLNPGVNNSIYWTWKRLVVIFQAGNSGANDWSSPAGQAAAENCSASGPDVVGTATYNNGTTTLKSTCEFFTPGDHNITHNAALGTDTLTFPFQYSGATAVYDPYVFADWNVNLPYSLLSPTYTAFNYQTLAPVSYTYATSFGWQSANHNGAPGVNSSYPTNARGDNWLSWTEMGPATDTGTLARANEYAPGAQWVCKNCVAQTATSGPRYTGFDGGHADDHGAQWSVYDYSPVGVNFLCWSPACQSHIWVENPIDHPASVDDQEPVPINLGYHSSNASPSGNWYTEIDAPGTSPAPPAQRPSPATYSPPAGGLDITGYAPGACPDPLNLSNPNNWQPPLPDPSGVFFDASGSWLKPACKTDTTAWTYHEPIANTPYAGLITYNNVANNVQTPNWDYNQYPVACGGCLKTTPASIANSFTAIKANGLTTPTYQVSWTCTWGSFNQDNFDVQNWDAGSSNGGATGYNDPVIDRRTGNISPNGTGYYVPPSQGAWTGCTNATVSWVRTGPYTVQRPVYGGVVSSTNASIALDNGCSTYPAPQPSAPTCVWYSDTPTRVNYQIPCGYADPNPAALGGGGTVNAPDPRCIYTKKLDTPCTYVTNSPPPQCPIQSVTTPEGSFLPLTIDQIQPVQGSVGLVLVLGAGANFAIAELARRRRRL